MVEAGMNVYDSPPLGFVCNLQMNRLWIMIRFVSMDLANVGALSHAASRVTRIFSIFDKNGEICHLYCITLLRLVVLLLTDILLRARLHGKL